MKYAYKTVLYWYYVKNLIYFFMLLKVIFIFLKITFEKILTPYDI